MDDISVLVRHWRSHVSEEAHDIPSGWYCNVYTDDRFYFEEWMNKNCPTADVTWRFNSGNPMMTVYIPSDAEASWFSLKWR